MTKPLRIAFMGTPDFAAIVLSALLETPHELACVYTQPPRKSGRGQKIQKSSVHVLADENGIDVRTPINFKDVQDVQDFQNLNLDVCIVAAYGLILPKVILDAPKHGCLNIHASLLPRWRGAAPIQRSIWAGDEDTGITLMQMDEGLDTGDIIAVKSCPITSKTNASTLHDRLADIGAEMTRKALSDLSAGQILPKTPQREEGANYATMLTKDDGRIDWAQSAAQIDRQIRALNPAPGTWCLLSADAVPRLKILTATPLAESLDGTAPCGKVLNKHAQIACGGGSVLQLMQVQPAGKKSMDAIAAINGGYICVGDTLF